MDSVVAKVVNAKDAAEAFLMLIMLQVRESPRGKYVMPRAARIRVILPRKVIRLNKVAGVASLE
jgi:hypothetical protein